VWRTAAASPAASTLVNANQPIDIVFNVDNTDGVTEYYLAEGVSNNTSLGIIAYTFELGFGTGLNFSRESTDDGLDFDTPDEDLTPTSGQFASIVHNPDVLKFSNGVIGAGLTDAFTLSIDVPDDLPGRQFTLRQLAVPVPEPSTLALVALIGLALSAIGLRNREGVLQHDVRCTDTIVDTAPVAYQSATTLSAPTHPMTIVKPRWGLGSGLTRTQGALRDRGLRCFTPLAW
jgi:hypothetical protein